MPRFEPAVVEAWVNRLNPLSPEGLAGAVVHHDQFKAIAGNVLVSSRQGLKRARCFANHVVDRHHDGQAWPLHQHKMLFNQAITCSGFTPAMQGWSSTRQSSLRNRCTAH